MSIGTKLIEKVISIMLFVLIFAVLFGGYTLYRSRREVAELRQQVASLQGITNEYTLPPHVIARVKLLDSRLTLVERLGADTITVIQSYVPPESEVIYTVQQDTVAWNLLTSLHEQLLVATDSLEIAQILMEIDSLKAHLFITTVDFARMGFCVKPFIGGAINASAGLGVNAGARLAYWNRYGIGLQGSVYFPEPDSLEFAIEGFAGARIPRLENTEVFLGGGYNFTKRTWEALFGIHVYLD